MLIPVTGVLFTYPKSNKIIETLMPEKAWTSIREIESNDNFLPRFKKDLSGLKAYNETHRFELEGKCMYHQWRN